MSNKTSKFNHKKTKNYKIIIKIHWIKWQIIFLKKLKKNVYFKFGTEVLFMLTLFYQQNFFKKGDKILWLNKFIKEMEQFKILM